MTAAQHDDCPKPNEREAIKRERDERVARAVEATKRG